MDSKEIAERLLTNYTISLDELDVLAKAHLTVSRERDTYKKELSEINSLWKSMGLLFTGYDSNEGK